jgi:hypothetical protein
MVKAAIVGIGVVITSPGAGAPPIRQIEPRGPTVPRTRTMSDAEFRSETWARQVLPVLERVCRERSGGSRCARYARPDLSPIADISCNAQGVGTTDEVETCRFSLAEDG